MRTCVVCGAAIRRRASHVPTCSADCTARRDRKGGKRAFDPNTGIITARHEMFEPLPHGARRRVHETL